MFLPVIDQEAFNLFDYPQLTGSPERRLLLAILERAILDFVGNDRLEREAAEEWLFGDLEEPSFDGFTFPWVCEQLDLNMEYVAETVRRMPKRGKNRVAPWYFSKGYFSKGNLPKENPARGSSRKDNSVPVSFSKKTVMEDRLAG